MIDDYEGSRAARYFCTIVSSPKSVSALLRAARLKRSRIWSILRADSASRSGIGRLEAIRQGAIGQDGARLAANQLEQSAGIIPYHRQPAGERFDDRVGAGSTDIVGEKKVSGAVKRRKVLPGDNTPPFDPVQVVVPCGQRRTRVTSQYELDRLIAFFVQGIRKAHGILRPHLVPTAKVTFHGEHAEGCVSQSGSGLG